MITETFERKYFSLRTLKFKLNYLTVPVSVAIPWTVTCHVSRVKCHTCVPLTFRSAIPDVIHKKSFVFCIFT